MFLNTVVIAHYFGSNTSTDIYFGMLAVALIITTTINGIDFLILVPESIRLREQLSEIASQRFANFFLYLYATIGMVIVAVISIAPTFFYSIFTSFDRSSLNENSNVLYCSGFVILFQLVNNFLGAVLSSYKYFTLSILTGLVNSGFSIAITLIFHQTLGLTGAVSGLVIGGFINFVLLTYVLKRYQSWRFSNFEFVSNRSVWADIGLMQINILPLWLRNSIGLFLITGIGTGLVTSLTLGQQLAAIPDVLILSQLLSVAGVKFAEIFSRKLERESRELFELISELGLYVTTLIGVGLLLFSSELVSVVFSRGNIDPLALRNIEIAFCFFVICLPAKFIASLCTGILTAAQKIKSIFVASLITHSVITVLMIALILNFGFWGYLIGINLHFYVFLLVFYPIFKRVLSEIAYGRIFTLLFANLLNNLIAYALVFLFFMYLPIKIHDPYLKLILGFPLYVLFVMLCNELTKVNRRLTLKNIYFYGKRKLSA